MKKCTITFENEDKTKMAIMQVELDPENNELSAELDFHPPVNQESAAGNLYVGMAGFILEKLQNL